MHALLWCNGKTPSDMVLTSIADSATVFGADGGADKAAMSGYDVAEVLGDLDSVSNGWEDKSTELADQSSSDLATVSYTHLTLPTIYSE